VNSSAGTGALVPPAVVTVTLTVPVPGGETAVIDSAEFTLTIDAGTGVEPKLTLLPLVKFVPVIVTSVPPASGPVFGVISVMVGAGR